MAEPGDKLITVILPRGKGAEVLEALYARKVFRASLGTARAPFFLTRKKRGFTRTVSHSKEKDILTVVAGADEAEELFAFIYEKAAIGKRYGGFMFMGPLAKTSSFQLPAGLPEDGPGAADASERAIESAS